MSEGRKPSLGVALIPIIGVIVCVLVGILVLGVDAQIPLLVAAIIATLVGKTLGYKWADMEQAMLESIGMGMQACLILMIIGALIGSWIAGGIVPSMIYYGLMIMKPSYFLAAVCIIGSIVSLATGSSWTTAGTVGIAALGIGAGLGIPAPVTAGAIISGAYFGDKMSPLSDTTNLAPAMAGSNLFDHIRHMVYTTGPSWVIATILFYIVGLKYAGGSLDYEAIAAMQEALKSTFAISPLLLIPPILVILMVVFKVPAIPGMIGGTLLGVICAFIQGYGLGDIIGFVHYGFESATGNVAVDDLLTRGGLDSMMWTISLILIALCFGGVVEKTRVMETIVGTITKFAKTRGTIVLSAVISCIALNFIAGDQYLAIVIGGRMYKPVFDKLRLHPKNLSRVLEDSGTLTSSLCPWNTCGAFMWGTLGVYPFAYAPYAFLNLINPLVSIFYGFTGITMEYLPEEKEEGAVTT